MNNTYTTEQEEFWAGDFGDDYISRNDSVDLLAANLHYFSNILGNLKTISSTFEVGCNIGMNTTALSLLLPKANHSGIEINKKAAEICRDKGIKGEIYHGSFLDFETNNNYDLVFSKGVLIHLNPEALQDVYKRMADMSKKYVLIGEYFNPSPVNIDYRSNTEKLFKRDFAAEFLQENPEFNLIDYAFHYKKANNFSQDNITWFLMEK